MNINKQKMRKILYMYIAVILVLLFFSKTIYNLSLPKVSVAMPTSGKLVKKYETYGEVTFAKSYGVFSGVSGRIEEIYVEKNDKIDLNGLIARVEKSSVQDEKTEIEFTIQKLKNNMEALQIDKAAFEREIDELLRNPKAKNKEDDKSLTLELKSIEEAIAIQEKNMNDTKLLYEIGGVAKAEYDTVIQNLEVLKKDKAKKLDEIEKQRDETQEDSEESEKLNTASLNQKKDSLAKTIVAIKEGELDLKKAELALSKAKPIAGDDNILKSSQRGVVIAVEKQKNSFISQGEKIATVGILDDHFMVAFSCPKAEGRFIEIGDEASISLGAKFKKVMAVVDEIKPEGEYLTIKLSFQAEGLTGGEYVKINFNKETESYDVLVPNESVFKGEKYNYIWVVQSKFGSLGTEYYSVRVNILIADTDESYTAVSKGMDYIRPVVINTSKDLTVNGRISQMDE